jgi:S1/P1 nuclease
LSTRKIKPMDLLLPRLLICLISTLLCLSQCQSAAAWNHKGHMLVALIAYRRLEPAQKTRINELLTQHPHYKQLLDKPIPVGASKEEWVFVRAATWPDLVRDDPYKASYHRQKWHYINLPFIPPSEEQFAAELKFEPPSPNVLFAIDEAKDVITEPYSSARHKATSLAWLEHLVGDIHQPLHCSALVTRAFRQGDFGGNALAVKADGTVKSLHVYWDEVLGAETDHATLTTAATSIAADPAHATPAIAESLKVLRSSDWAQEGFAHARAKVYLDGRLPIADYFAYKKQQLSEGAIPTLDVAYQQEALRLARERVFLGGSRLAAVLNELFSDTQHH